MFGVTMLSLLIVSLLMNAKVYICTTVSMFYILIHMLSIFELKCNAQELKWMHLCDICGITSCAAVTVKDDGCHTSPVFCHDD